MPWLLKGDGMSDSKQYAHSLQASLKDLGHEISLGHCYEVVAKLQGFKSWNAATATTLTKKQERDLQDAMEALDGLHDVVEKLFDEDYGFESHGILSSEARLALDGPVHTILRESDTYDIKYFTDSGIFIKDQKEAIKICRILNSHPRLLGFFGFLHQKIKKLSPQDQYSWLCDYTYDFGPLVQDFSVLQESFTEIPIQKNVEGVYEAFPVKSIEQLQKWKKMVDYGLSIVRRAQR